MKMKKIVAGLLATAMVITGISIAPKQAEAAVVTDIVYEYCEDYSEYLEGNKAPAFDGEGRYFSDGDIYMEDEIDITGTEEYLFGGWYGVSDDEEYIAIGQNAYGDYTVNKEVVDLDDIVGATGDGAGLFAKWVPASVLSVKAQNTAGVTAESSTTNTRILSSVDSLDYSAVGFEILLNNKTKLDGIETTKVYDELIGSGSTYTADQIFGGGATHFVVWRLTGIQKVNFEKIIYVRPYWITADGVKVEGLAKYVHVEDEYNKYISVPINLNVLSEKKVAAGVVEISYPAGLTFVEEEFETGRVFEEREFADKGSSIKIAANVQNISENKDANDIYMNLRFKVSDISKLDDNGDNMVHTECNFEIQGTPDFCDKDEVKQDIDIWDVLY